jgi:hypothetical protein
LFIKEGKKGYFNTRTQFTIEALYKELKIMAKGVLQIKTARDKMGYIDDFGNEYFADTY